MTGWKSKKWSGVESLKGEGIPARNDPSESPSQAVILIIIHFDGTKVGFLFFFSTQRKRNMPQWASKIWWQKTEVSVLLIYLFFAISVSLSHAVNVDPASSNTKIGGSDNNGQFWEFYTPRDNHTLSHAYSHTNALSCAHIAASVLLRRLAASSCQLSAQTLIHCCTGLRSLTYTHINTLTQMLQDQSALSPCFAVPPHSTLHVIAFSFTANRSSGPPATFDEGSIDLSKETRID